MNKRMMALLLASCLLIEGIGILDVKAVGVEKNEGMEIQEEEKSLENIKPEKEEKQDVESDSIEDAKVKKLETGIEDIVKSKERQENQLERHQTDEFKVYNKIQAVNISGGSCGKNAVWSLDDTGTLMIEGTGAIDSVNWRGQNERIKNVVIKEGITSIGSYAFGRCREIKNVTLPVTLTSIGRSAFQDCSSLEKIVFPKRLKVIDTGAFWNCSSLEEIIIPNSVERIGGSNNNSGASFAGCSSAKKIKIGTGIKEINFRTFSECSSVREIVIPNSVKIIGENAFENCVNLVNLKIGKSVYDIKGYAFAGCKSLQELIIPDNVVRFSQQWDTLGSNSSAFAECTNLKKVIMGSGVSYIGGGLFRQCTSLREIYFCGNAPVFDQSGYAWEAFKGVTAVAYYPGNDKTWNASNMTNHDGNITWKAWRVPIKHKRITLKEEITAKGIKLQWNKVAGAKGYYIYRKSGNKKWKKIKNISKKNTSKWTDKDVKNGQKYTYKICAYDSSEVTPDSNLIKTGYLNQIKLTEITRINTSYKMSGGMRVGWSPNKKADGYTIRYGTTKKAMGDTKYFRVRNKKSILMAIYGLSKGRTYYVSIRCYKKWSDRTCYSSYSPIRKIEIK